MRPNFIEFGANWLPAVVIETRRQDILRAVENDPGLASLTRKGIDSVEASNQKPEIITQKSKVLI